MQNESKLVALGGLWESTDKSGSPYFSGRLGMAKILIFRNRKKESEKQPDYMIYVAPWEDRGGENRGKSAPREADPAAPQDDELPF